MVNMDTDIELEWLIHYKCNYRCPYCFFEGFWEEVEKRNNYLPAEKWIAAWKHIFKAYKSVRIIITGGEPFIYPSFVQIIKELSRHCLICFDTNLSCSYNLLADFVRHVIADNISMALSFHPQFADFDSFMEKALFLKENNYRVSVQYVSYPPQINMMEDYRKKFESTGFYFMPIPFRGKYDGKIYPDSFSESEKMLIYNTTQGLVDEHKEKVDKQLNQVSTKGKLCFAGATYARVDYDGTVYRCGHSVSNPLNKPLCNLFDAGFKLFEGATPCEQDKCPCEFRWLADKTTEYK
jgi:MoaA/NifB/PqqE/SkfB family radical SAM enzyme